MQLVIILLLFLLGLIIMVKGGDWFVDSAIWIASVTGMPQIFIGATIVSLATTLPELFVSTIATLQGYTDVAIGNAIGSVICNIGLVLAITLLFMPAGSHKKLLNGKALLMIGATLILLYLIRDRMLAPYEGVILLCFLGLYIYMNIMEVKKSGSVQNEHTKPREKPDARVVLFNAGKFIIGTLMIVVGARMLVDNGIQIGALLYLPESIIGVTIIAIGTSLPELTTAISAITKGHYGLSFGNILGANILNITMILGTSAVLSGDGLLISGRNIHFFGHMYPNIPQTLFIDVPVAVFIMLLLILPALLSLKMKRWHGGSLLAVYILYIGFMISISL